MAEAAQAALADFKNTGHVLAQQLESMEPQDEKLGNKHEGAMTIAESRAYLKQSETGWPCLWSLGTTPAAAAQQAQ